MSKKIYMKFGNIKGNVQDSVHKDYFVIKSFNFDLNRDVSNHAGTDSSNYGTPRFSNVSFTKIKDNSVTPDIFTKTASGTSEDCIIHVLTGGANPTVETEYILKNATFTSYKISEKEAEKDVPTEENINIAFTRIECNHTIMTNGKATSSRSAGYDLKTNQVL